jgi:inorganic pyrophosphatase
MTNLLKIPTWADEENVYAIVETPRGSTCKLDFDPKLRVFTLAKPLMAGLTTGGSSRSTSAGGRHGYLQQVAKTLYRG